MAITRLLLSRTTTLPSSTRVHFPARWNFHSSSYLMNKELLSNDLAKEEASSVKKSVGTKREVFSEATEVQNKIGFPWNRIKNMFTSVKDKVLRNHESQYLSNGLSASLQNPGVQEFIIPCTNLHNAEPDSVVQCTEAISGGQSEKQTSLTKSPFRKENKVSVSAISDIVKAVYPEDSKHNRNLDTDGGKENKIRSLESLKVYRKGKIPKRNITFVDIDLPIESKNKKKQPKEDVSSRLVGCQTNRKNGNEHLRCLATEMVENATKTLYPNASEKLAAAGSLGMNSSPNSTGSIKNSDFVRSISDGQGKEIVSNGESFTSSVSGELSVETMLGEATEVVSIAGGSKSIEEPLIEQSSVRSEDDVLNTKVVANNKAAVVLTKGKSKEGKFFSEGHAMSVDDNVGNRNLGKSCHAPSGWLSSQVRQIPPKDISMGVSEVCTKSNTIKGQQEEEVKDMLKVLARTDAPKKSTDLIPEKRPLKDNSDIIPSLVGDPDVPKVLVKNPTRTVLIKHLSNCISLRHLKEALGFCGCSIASISFGASHSFAYVEFETEDAKERAIAKHSIEINGVQLTILRIDAPRTTVVRLSMSDLPKEDPIFGKVISSCFPDQHQKRLISSARRRSRSVLDVTFRMEQWPNMLRILNRMNGVVVDGIRYTALPAPIYPPEVLQRLWKDPVERRGVLAVMRRLLSEVNNPFVSCGLNDLLGKYHGENLK